MKTIQLTNLSKKDYERIVCRSLGTNEEVMPDVKKIIAGVEQLPAHKNSASIRFPHN